MHLKYVVDDKENPYTATGYANLYCDKSTSRNIVQSAIYIGSIIGLLVLTPFADEKGNKKVFLIAIGICILGLLRKFSTM